MISDNYLSHSFVYPILEVKFLKIPLVRVLQIYDLFYLFKITQETKNFLQNSTSLVLL